MAGIKSLASKILYYSPLSKFLHLNFKNKLIVCNYHRLYDKEVNTRFDEGVFAHSVKHLKNHLEWLKSNTRILSETELILLIKTGNPMSGMSSVVTFDDGYIDNYTLAYPILKELCVPAIFFIPTSPINTRELGWWDIIAYLIKTSKKKSIYYDNECFNLEAPKGVIRTFQKIMATKPHHETSNLITMLSSLCDVPLPDIQTQSEELMSWDQIREISENNISIGSHSNRHLVLSTMSHHEQKDDLISSKLIIENNINKPVRTVAYPVGGYQHFTRETLQLASECGYEAGFSFNTGVNDLLKLGPYTIKRIEPPSSEARLATLAAFPELFNNL